MLDIYDREQFKSIDEVYTKFIKNLIAFIHGIRPTKTK